jgi:two-component system sensor histidine kinase PilS (NtrC family)
VTSCNPAFIKLTGYLASDLIGLPFGTFLPAVMLTETEQARQVVDLQKKDSGMIRARYTSAHLNLPPDPRADAPGEAQCKVITIQDISLLEKMERQVRDAEKMAAIGELSAAIAHDFRNPITAIAGSAQLLKNVHPASEGTDILSRTNRHLIEIILRESGRMEKTITDFLQFARPSALTPEWFDLRLLTEETIRQIQSRESCPLSASMEIDIPEHLDCWADRQLVQIMLTHLVENSCAAAAEQGNWPVTVKAREQDIQGRNSICITVIDRGNGIEPSLWETVFLPFFSTRTNCAGLGLAIVRQLAEQHGGKVNILTPEADQGCVVSLCLPLPQLPEDY